MKDEALKLALEALEHCKEVIIERGLGGNPEFAKKWSLNLPLERAGDAITALKQALAAPVQPAHPDSDRIDWLTNNPLEALDIFGRVKGSDAVRWIRQEIDNAIAAKLKETGK